MIELTKSTRSHTINSMRKNKSPMMLVIGLVIVILLAVIVVLGWKLYSRDEPAANDEKTSERIIDKVSKIYLLPENEDPAIVQIQDVSQLEGQDFFKKAINGDYLLAYEENNIAIIYREPDNKLINIGFSVAGSQENQGDPESP